MSKIEVLVATMNQKDFSLFEKMNIQTDVIFCNQTDKNEYSEKIINGHRARMFSTTTKGVGVNRNFAMLLSDAEICLLADDDMVYNDGYEKVIYDEFEKNRKADVIIFNKIEASGEIIDKRRPSFTKRVGYGACRIAYRNKNLKYKNISFSTLFGGGTIYSSGEDTVFLRELIKKHLKIYRSDKIIGRLLDERKSTWFNGYTDKFFFDKGALIKAIFPKTGFILKYYYIYRFRKKGDQNLIRKIKLFNSGAKAFKKMKKYKSE